MASAFAEPVVETIDESQISDGKNLILTGNQCGPPPQTTFRMYSFNAHKYPASALKALMQNEHANIYNRYCAAYFLMRDDSDARAFIEKEVTSVNLQHRYNAANILSMYVNDNPNDDWGTNLLIKIVATGLLDGNVMDFPLFENHPDGDGDDNMMSPLNDICRQFGNRKEIKALDALIGVAERLPSTSGATYALGELGDPKAIPVLLKIAKNRNEDYERRAISALGKLKCKEAVPLLIRELGIGRKYPSNDGISDSISQMDDETILNALLMMGDAKAIPAIEKYIKQSQPKENKDNIAAANRVLAQLKSKDPVPRLIELYNGEDYEPSKSDILYNLQKYPDARVIVFLANQASQSDSAFLRRVSITVLGKIASRESLLKLVDLLGVPFPKKLKAEWGWKGPPDDFSVYFPQHIIETLTESTKQKFGADSAKWRTWIIANVKEP